MHLWHSLLISTCWWWEVTSARGREKKVLKEQLLFWRKKRPRLCISKLRSNEFYSAESWRIGIERFGGTHLKFSGCNWYKIEFGKGKGQPGGSIQKSEPRGQNPCSPGFEEWTLEEIARQADCDSKVAWNLERKKAQCCGREILSSDRIETLREGPKTVSRYWPRLGKSANNRGRTSFVRDFDLFVTVRLLDETPAVLLLHILCSKHRYPFEWKIGETSRLATHWKSIARTFVWKGEPRFGRWCFKSGDSKNVSTVLILTSANTERDLFPQQKRLVTWKQHRGTRSHFFSGYYPCETKTSQETEKNFWNINRAVTEAKSYFYERFVEIWQVLWRITMESSDKLSSHRSETTNCRTSCTSSKRRNISRIIAIWIDSRMMARFHEMLLSICRKSKATSQTGNLRSDRRSGESFLGPITLLTHWLDISQNSEKNKARIHQFGKKLSQEFLIGCALFAGRNLRRRSSNYWGRRIV